MPEGLGTPEVGKEIGHHARHSTQEQRDRILSIAEAVLLSLVALLAGWSGYAAAKWSTESRVGLADSSTARTEASRADLEAMEVRNFDSSTFEAWFAAYTVRQRAGDGGGRAPLPPRVPGCVRRLARDEPRVESAGAPWADATCRSTGSRSWRGRCGSTKRQTRRMPQA